MLLNNSVGKFCLLLQEPSIRSKSLIKINIADSYNGYYANRSLKNNVNYLLTLKEFCMKIKYLAAVVTVLMLIGCGKPSAPETPDPSTYGQTIQPFHQIPSDAQDGGGKARSTQEKSGY